MVIEALRPPPELEHRIRGHIQDELGLVLPPRAVDHYYDTVVLGVRSADVLRTLLSYDRPDGPVADVGAGLGTFVLLARASGVEAIGVEPEPEALSLARERASIAGLPEGILRSGPGERLPLEDGECAAILLHDVLEHVDDWRAVLAECHRALAPGGLVYVKGPSYTTRCFEPHYRLPWVPLLPRPLARGYLRALGRDTAYLAHIGYRRRGPVLRELRRLGLELSFPRRQKLREPASINRRWARAVVRLAGPLGRVLAENPLQATIDVVARRPGRR